MYSSFISPSPSLTVFKDNRGDQSFKIHNSTQMWRKKTFPKQGQVLPGVRNNKEATNQQSIFTFLNFLAYKMHPPDTMLQIQKYQLRISSISQSICLPVPTETGDCLSQGAGPCTWPCSASWGSPGSTFPACPAPHREKCETLANTLFFLNKFLLQAFVMKRKISHIFKILYFIHLPTPGIGPCSSPKLQDGKKLLSAW